MNMKLTGAGGLALAAALAFTTATPSAVSAGSLKDTYEPEPVAMWAGCYLGGHAGGAWEDDGDVEKFEKKYKLFHQKKWWEVEKFKHDEDDDAGLIGGVHAGCNWQDGEAVYGVEGDIGFGDGIDYLASLRGRLGWAMDDLLLYLTAGVGFLGADDDFEVSYFSPVSHKRYDWSFEDDTNEVGLVLGGGLEHKLDPNWSVGLEGLYYFFGDDDSEHKWKAFCKKDHCFQKFHLEREKDNDIFTVRARLTYHFDEVEEELEPYK